jgi:S1-C subfamily serine protease
MMLFNNGGELVGTTRDNRVIPAWLISSQIGSLLEKNAVKYSLINWKGWMVNGVEWEGKWKNLNGFYISEASGLTVNKTVKVGDVIIKINGDAVSDQTLAEKIFIAPDEFKVTVWRKGAEIEVVVKKEIVKP